MSYHGYQVICTNIYAAYHKMVSLTVLSQQIDSVVFEFMVNLHVYHQNILWLVSSLSDQTRVYLELTVAGLFMVV